MASVGLISFTAARKTRVSDESHHGLALRFRHIDEPRRPGAICRKSGRSKPRRRIGRGAGGRSRL